MKGRCKGHTRAQLMGDLCCLHGPGTLGLIMQGLLVSFLRYVCRARDGTQGPLHARQVFCIPLTPDPSYGPASFGEILQVSTESVETQSSARE